MRFLTRCLRFLFAWIAILFGCGLLRAQHAVEIDPGDSAVPITLGRAAVPLYGPWKFTIGDSPIDPKTGQPLWAEPEFDDSKWEMVDLRPKRVSFSYQFSSDEVLGWTDRGHPGYSGYAWYRIRVRVRAADSGQAPSLALGGPASVDDAYQLFADGRLLGSFGRFSGREPTIYNTQPMLFEVPNINTGNGPAPERVLAFRFWMAPMTAVIQAGAGGLHTAPLLGQAEVVSAAYQLRWLQIVYADAHTFVVGGLYFLLAVVSLSLARFDRSEPAYRWLSAVALLLLMYIVLFYLTVFTQTLSVVLAEALSLSVLRPLRAAGWVMVWWSWFRLDRESGWPRWIPWITALLTVFYGLTIAIASNFFYPAIPVTFAERFAPFSIAARLLLFGLMLLVVALEIRRRGVEGWVVLPAVLLLGVEDFFNELRFLHLRVSYHIGAFRYTIATIANLLLLAGMLVLLLRRLGQSLRRQRETALDIKSAQEVQQVILPEAVTRAGGFTIESEYRPAREVGGDFYQVIPNEKDGSLLIVAGDVAGKGLQAGMLVALLVGAIRSTSELNSDPLFVLQALNRRLLGRGNAHATCLALRIESSGAATLANAGHLPPYLNGKPVAIEGSMPLGFFEDAEFSVLRFELEPGDRLVLTSDGLAEATNAEGRLFGFEVIQKLAANRASAAEMANAAEGFGQEDDISVITVTRMAVPVPA